MLYEIPLQSNSQTFPININSVVLNLTIIWRSSQYILDIADSTGTPIVQGIALTTGANLLEQYAYLNLPGSWWVISDDGLLTPPTYSDLGQTVHLMVSV